MSIENLNLDPRTLKPNPWNTNVVSPANEEKLKTSIQRFGMFKPVIVRTLDDGSYQIIGGEHRAHAAIELGYEVIPVFNLGKVDDKKAKEISLVDNGRFGEDDTLKLSELIAELGGIGEVADFVPYLDVEIESIFNSTIALDELEALEVPDEDVKAPSEPAAKRHQIMRFKVPSEDVDAVTAVIEHIIKTQGFTESDSLTNAGDALVYLAKGYKK